jgi:cyclopropane fatty-acyl-phospholipid synthase-like methyltransferase
MTNVTYCGFDASPTSIEYFAKEQFPSDRFYASLEIDKTILSKKYDLIFSAYVLQHVGYPASGNTANDLVAAVLPCLKDDGVMFFHELHQGQNSWSPQAFVAWLNTQGLIATDKGPVTLNGGDNDAHNLIVACKWIDD